MCGGTTDSQYAGYVCVGLSPRVRGNPAVSRGKILYAGSIPACAGEPVSSHTSSPRPPVYPRVCGGTSDTDSAASAQEGLSPRVRGNRKLAGKDACRPGVYPACAGEPTLPPPPITQADRLSRVCGGTNPHLLEPDIATGSIPRVRGNQTGAGIQGAHQRSIPACAGEPRSGILWQQRPLVYPRVCGGTLPVLWECRICRGLSPRVRGNRLPDGTRWTQGGSIPACAGEPLRRSSATAAARVYPRVCGGTACRMAPGGRRGGLSPRVRGNRYAGLAPRRRPGSIPACAGEPPAGWHPVDAGGVYPRVCGGTATPV